MNRGCLMNDLSNKLGISIASYTGQYKVIEESIQSCINLKAKYTGISIENRNVSAENNSDKYLNLFKKMDSILFVKNLIANRGGAWVSQHLANTSLIKTFNPEVKYLLLINGDCVIRNSVGFHEVLEEFALNNSDILPTARFIRKGRCFGTMGIIGKLDSTIEMLKMMNRLIVDNFFTRSGNEHRMAVACRKLNLKIFNVISPKNVSFCSFDEGTWAGRMGFFHLHNEWSKVKYGMNGWWNSEKSS